MEASDAQDPLPVTVIAVDAQGLSCQMDFIIEVLDDKDPAVLTQPKNI